MSEPTKDKAHVIANPDAFREAYARAREIFGKIEGVVGVAFGQKRVGLEYQDNVAIVVFVKEKKKEEDIPPAQRIPPSFEGYPTDVRVVRKGIAEVCDNTTKYDKIKGGIQIMVERTSGYNEGTLGCLVKKRGDRGRENVYLLTNKHVLYSPGKGAGADVRHPSQEDSLLGTVQEGGLYGNFPYPAENPAAPQYFIDAAIARIHLDSTCCGSTCTKDTTEVEETLIVDLQVNGVNSIGDVRDVTNDPLISGAKVFKVGRTTGKTTGFVRLVNAPLTADPPPDQAGGANVAAQNTIYVEFDVTSAAGGKNCKGNPCFTEQGDSGSVYVDEQSRVIGLHTHRGVPVLSPLEPSHGCHILPVLDHLRICIPVTTGTSHGSSGATDGSGIEPFSPTAPLGPGDFPLPDGQIGFASQQIAAERTPTLGFPDPAPLSDEEAEHMRELLDALRETAKGRELHRVFGDVRREIGYLIRNCRPVKVAWHRNQGPAFFALFLNHIKGYTAEVPREVKGIPRDILLARMAEALRAHGGNSLRRAIDEYSEELIAVIPTLNSAQDCIVFLRQTENS
jgi:hypothetical protein